MDMTPIEAAADLNESVERLRAYYEWAHNHFVPADGNPYRNFKTVTSYGTVEQTEDMNEVVMEYLATNSPEVVRERKQLASLIKTMLDLTPHHHIKIQEPDARRLLALLDPPSSPGEI